MYHLTTEEQAQAVRLLGRIHKVLNNKPIPVSVATLLAIIAELCILDAQGNLEDAKIKAKSMATDIENQIIRVYADVIKRKTAMGESIQ